METIARSTQQESNVIRDAALQKELLIRRERLKASVADVRNTGAIIDLLRDVDAALDRMEKGTFGICETCHETLENDRLLVDPLCRNCLDHLSEKERRAMERDLDLAYQVQRGLLPKPELAVDGWQVSYHYDPAGSVSGDYCDIISVETEPGSFYFLVGDVTGKGVAASLLMSHLHATFRSLVTARLPVHELVHRANRVFCEGTLTTHFATLVCGKAGKDGHVEICNAGHCLPIHVAKDTAHSLPSTGLPLGLVCESVYSSVSLDLAAGDSLVLYTDGLTEATDPGGAQYGDRRPAEVAKAHSSLAPGQLISKFLDDLRTFRMDARGSDDLTLMVVKRG